MSGVAVGPPIAVRGASVDVRIGKWRSGLYFARIRARHSAGYAPVIVRAAVPGRNRVAVVLPTNTWQAYNFLDQDHNGYGDTWYADPRVDTVRLDPPFMNRASRPTLATSRTGSS
jgi:hypothetical protein